MSTIAASTTIAAHCAAIYKGSRQQQERSENEEELHV
jgi:hypothetical protein